MILKLNSILNFCLNLLFPVSCLICHKISRHPKKEKYQGYLCQNCFRLLKLGPPNFKLQLNHIDEIIVAGNYDDPLLATLIKNFKYSGLRALGPALGDWLSLALQGRIILREPENPLIIPVPLTKRKYRQRGFNQTELIAKRLADNFDYELSLDLKKIKNTKSQTKLSYQKRQKNLKNCFKWQGEDLAARQIILVDDIITTGATMQAAAEVIKEAGATRITALAVAKG